VQAEVILVLEWQLSLEPQVC
jgi:hypothetical protein